MGGSVSESFFLKKKQASKRLFSYNYYSCLSVEEPSKHRLLLDAKAKPGATSTEAANSGYLALVSLSSDNIDKQATCLK